MKARLVCRGFEETIEVQSDSPTGSKETLCILLAIAASKGRTIKSDNITKAYLQGKEIKGLVYMEPLVELKRLDKLWKLKKSGYGMNDAGRKWWRRWRRS